MNTETLPVDVTPLPPPDRLADLKAEIALDLEMAVACVVRARREEDAKLLKSAARAASGLNLSDDAGSWRPVYLWPYAVGFIAAVVAVIIRSR